MHQGHNPMGSVQNIIVLVSNYNNTTKLKSKASYQIRFQHLLVYDGDFAQSQNDRDALVLHTPVKNRPHTAFHPVIRGLSAGQQAKRALLLRPLYLKDRSQADGVGCWGGGAVRKTFVITTLSPQPGGSLGRPCVWTRGIVRESVARYGVSMSHNGAR